MEGFLTEDQVAEPIQIHTTPITDVYTLESRPFARGKYAQVKRCHHKVSQVSYAAKCMRKCRRSKNVRHEILHEAYVLKTSASCQHMVNLHEVYETPTEIFIILEMVSGGELQRVLDNEEVISEDEATRLLSQILQGVSFMHKHNIAHLDLKPQNILLTGQFPDCDVRLCDFGISRVVSPGSEVREIVGTPDYVAPEILQYEPISLSTDMWSIGVLAYVLLSGHTPYGGETKQETFCNITQNHLEFPPELFKDCSSHSINFIKNLLICNPRDRMTVEQCLLHPWLNKNIPTTGPSIMVDNSLTNNCSSNQNVDNNNLSKIEDAPRTFESELKNLNNKSERIRNVEIVLESDPRNSSRDSKRRLEEENHDPLLKSPTLEPRLERRANSASRILTNVEMNDCFRETHNTMVQYKRTAFKEEILSDERVAIVY